MIEKLITTLTSIQQTAGSEFSGIGLIICENPENLPIFPLRLNEPLFFDDNLISHFVEISTINNNYHDGFHILSKNFEILKFSQYFAPPITLNAPIDRTKLFGCRYLTAFFGSTLPNVIATGIASNKFGIAVFKNGQEIYFHKT